MRLAWAWPTVLSEPSASRTEGGLVARFSEWLGQHKPGPAQWCPGGCWRSWLDGLPPRCTQERFGAVGGGQALAKHERRPGGVVARSFEPVTGIPKGAPGGWGGPGHVAAEALVGSRIVPRGGESGKSQALCGDAFGSGRGPARLHGRRWPEPAPTRRAASARASSSYLLLIS